MVEVIELQSLSQCLYLVFHGCLSLVASGRRLTDPRFHGGQFRSRSGGPIGPRVGQSRLSRRREAPLRPWYCRLLCRPGRHIQIILDSLHSWRNGNLQLLFRTRYEVDIPSPGRMPQYILSCFSSLAESASNFAGSVQRFGDGETGRCGTRSRMLSSKVTKY